MEESSLAALESRILRNPIALAVGITVVWLVVMGLIAAVLLAVAPSGWRCG